MGDAGPRREDPDQNAVRARSSNSDGPRAIGARLLKIAPIEPRQALDKESFHEDPQISEPLAKGHRLIGQLAANVEIAPHDMKSKISPHHREKLRGLADALAQFAGAMENGADFRRRVASRGDISRSQRYEKLQFAKILGRGLQGFKQLQSFEQVTARLHVRKVVPRPEASLQMISDRFLDETGFGEVLGQTFRLRLRQLTEPLLDNFGDPLMKSATIHFADGIVERFLYQRMLE